MQKAIDRREFLTEVLKKSALAGGVLLGLSATDLVGVAPASALGTADWGALCLPGDGQSSQEAAVAALEKKVGRLFDTTHYRMPWTTPLVNSFTSWSAKTGHPKQILSWFARTKSGLVSWKGIAAGNYDSWITTQAKNLKSSGFSGFFCFHKEPENEGTPTDWKAAYTHVKKIFDSVGVTGFKWVVGLCASTYSNGTAGDWLPGQYDVLGVDGYNRNLCGSSNGWRSFTTIFQAARNFASSQGKPLYVIECGCVEGAPGAKATWIANAAAQIESWPEIIGFSYNHESTDCTYWADSTTSALNAFTTMGSQVYFGG
jgi:hypothetical protein